jgi:putative methyltransferase (TIGR04325 family)
MLRSLLEDLMPPVLFRSIKGAWRQVRGLKPYDFYGAWASLDDVPVDNGGDPWAQTLAPSQFKNLKAMPTVDRTGHLILPLLASQFSGSLTVLDFGGSRGNGLSHILKYARRNTAAELSYVLVETPAMCAAIRDEIEPHYGRVTSEIPSELPSPLIVHAGSSIQYLADYRRTLSDLTNLQPEFFIISQTPMTDVPTYARQLFSVPHRTLRTWVFNRAEFVSLMRGLSYRLIFSVDHDLPLTHKNAPGPSVISSMVFMPN